MIQTVWVAETGEWSDRAVSGVYRSLQQAIDAHPISNDASPDDDEPRELQKVWHAEFPSDPDSNWVNGCRYGNKATITSWNLPEEVVAAVELEVREGRCNEHET